MMGATVRDVMHTQVIWVEEDTPFAAMATALGQYRVSAFPVIDKDERVIGVVSEADMLAKEALGNGEDEMPGMITGILRYSEMRKARGATAGEIMTAPPITVTQEAPVEYAARLMYVRRVKRLPVVNADRRLVGIISRADVLSVFGRPDDEIRVEVAGNVPGSGLLTVPETVAVGVRDGVVTLAGTIESRYARDELARRARHVQGVVAVRDHLKCP